MTNCIQRSLPLLVHITRAIFLPSPSIHQTKEPIYAAWSFFFKSSLSVTASAANLLIPSRSFSTAMASSLKSNRKSASLSMYVFFGMSRLLALAASSFLGTTSWEFIKSSRRLGYICIRLVLFQFSSAVNLGVSTYRDCKVITTSQLCNLTNISE